MHAEGRSPFQKAVARLYNSPVGLGGGAYHGGTQEGEAESAYLGVMRRAVLDEVGDPVAVRFAGTGFTIVDGLLQLAIGDATTGLKDVAQFRGFTGEAPLPSMARHYGWIPAELGLAVPGILVILAGLVAGIIAGSFVSDAPGRAPLPCPKSPPKPRAAAPSPSFPTLTPARPR